MLRNVQKFIFTNVHPLSKVHVYDTSYTSVLELQAFFTCSFPIVWQFLCLCFCSINILGFRMTKGPFSLSGLFWGRLGNLKKSSFLLP